MTMSDQVRAERSAEAMWAGDAASRFLGVRLDEVGPGTAKASLMVDAHHLNGHAICHGGIIFMLADTAFAFACNSYNRTVVAQQNLVTFLRPARQGDRLDAEATEVSRQGRTGIYDVTVRVGSDAIALFRGQSRQIPGEHFQEPAE